MKRLITYGKLVEARPLYEIWEEMLQCHLSENTLQEKYTFLKIGKAVTPEKISQILRSERCTYDSLVLFGENIEVEQGQFLGYFPTQKRITFSFQEPGIPNLGNFVRRFMATKNVVNFTISDEDYQIDERYKPYFSPPVSDLLKAPCYRNQREHYIEGISAEMWFGDAFWQYASCSKEEVIATDWLEVEQRPDHLYVKAWPEPFDNAEGEQGEIQRRLLKLFFDIG